MDKKLFEILACPLCKTRLFYDVSSHRLICRIDKLAFPIQDEVPVMLVDEAIKLKSECRV